jgi:hypothetical protein
MPSLALVIPPPSVTQTTRRMSTSDLLRHIPDAPMTPPLSPGHSELGVDPIVVDSEPHYGALEHDATVTIQPQVGEMEVDCTKPSDTVPNGPLRLLEDEHMHLEKSGLSLSDFQVRGTLGWYPIVC